MQRTLTLWLAVALLLAGCGSDGPLGSSSAPPLGRALYGMVLLDRPRSGVPVELQTLDGRVLAETRSDAGALFKIPQGSAPERFRVVARLPEGDVQCLGGSDSPFLAVNALSHLIALSGGDEARVRRGLGIPPETALNGLSNLRGSPFSHQLFLAQAAQNGGFPAFSESVARRLERGETLSFRLDDTLGSVRAKVTGGDVVSWVAGAAGSDIFTFGLNSLLSAVTAGLGMNVGVASNLKTIENQLDQLSLQINAIETALLGSIGASNVSTQYNQIYNQIANGDDSVYVKLTVTNISSAANLASIANGSSGNFTHGAPIPNPVSTLTSNVQSARAQGVGNVVATYLANGPSDNPVNLFNEMSAYGLGENFATANNQANFFSYALRRDIWTAGVSPSPPTPFPSPLTSPSPSGAVTWGTGVQGNLDFFTGTLLQCLYLIAESGQIPLLQSSSRSPASVLNTARQQVLQGMSAIATAQNMVPAPTNCEWVYLDLVNGLMWCTVLMEPADLQQAEQVAAGFRLGPWSGWTVPTSTQLTTLRNQLSPPSQNNQGLVQLGFTGPQIADVDVMLCSDFGSYSFSSGGPYFFNGEVSYLLVRPFPNVATGDSADLVVRSYGMLPDALAIGNVSGTLQAYAQSGSQNVTVSDRVTWTSSNDQLMQLVPTTDGVVPFFYFQKNTAGQTVTTTASLRGSSGGQLKTVNATIATTVPAFTVDLVRLNPPGTFYQGRPSLNDELPFYLTGWLKPAGSTPLQFPNAPFDMTGESGTQFAAYTSAGQPLNADIAAFKGAPGVLVFGANAVNRNQTILVGGNYTVNGTVYQAANATVSW